MGAHQIRLRSARRNGKNEIAAIRELYGLKQGESILHTAHRTTTSRAAWERLCHLLDKAKIPYKSIQAVGREHIQLEDSAGRIEFRTRSSKGGLGERFRSTGDRRSAGNTPTIGPVP